MTEPRSVREGEVQTWRSKWKAPTNVVSLPGSEPDPAVDNIVEVSQYEKNVPSSIDRNKQQN